MEACAIRAGKIDVPKRLSYSEGHLGGIRKMVVEDNYRADILRQAVAVRKAIEKLRAGGIKTGHEKAVIEEIDRLYTLAGTRGESAAN
jgi:DNA-binding FrmR family transcriptional regulator